MPSLKKEIVPFIARKSFYFINPDDNKLLKYAKSVRDSSHESSSLKRFEGKVLFISAMTTSDLHNNDSSLLLTCIV